jgi:D-glycero-D-manno-heptose 1,7-bisphosphate phosphatase
VFLDRDGVLNRAIVRGGKPYPPAGLDELEVPPGVPGACRLLKDAGFLLVVVTNQPDVARGTQTPEAVEAIHRALRSRLPLDDVRVCFHDDASGCHCRKPKPGLLLDAARDWNIDLGRSFLVGDRWKDISAGRAAGCTTVFLDYQYAEPTACQADYSTSSLEDAVTWILGVHEPALPIMEKSQ